MILVRVKIVALETISAHVDYIEILDWLSQSQINPKKVFVTHGEIEAANQMKEHIEQKFKWSCEVPKQDQEFMLE